MSGNAPYIPGGFHASSNPSTSSNVGQPSPPPSVSHPPYPSSSSSALMWATGEDVSVEVNQRALIDKILARYSGEFTIFRELLQNADDAGAKNVKIQFMTEKGVGGMGCKQDISSETKRTGSRSGEQDLPDLKHTKIHRYVVTNDGIPFRDQDWNRLRKIAEGNPDDDKIGAFGVGFYALFSITESPLVESGNKFMGFYWKDGKDQLFARAGTLPEGYRIDGGTGEGDGHELGDTANDSTTNPWTRFSMDLREPVPIDQPLEFSRFLVTSLTFMLNIRHISMYVDDHPLLTITKDVGITSAVDTRTFTSQRGATGSKSPQGVMNVQGVQVTGVKMKAKIMRWLMDSGFTAPPLPPAKPIAAITARAGGFASMLQSALFSRVSGSSTSTAALSDNNASTPKQEGVVKNPHDFLKHEMNLRIFAADVQVNVGRDLGRELERATKKPPPKRTKLQLIFSPADESELASTDINSGTNTPTSTQKTSEDGSAIFAGLKPDLAGDRTAKIFIGQATAQTTGIAGHIAARFIPTVERESIDLQDRHVSIWNKELLYVGGYISRVIYELEMSDIAKVWSASSLGTGGSPDKNVSQWLTSRGLHALRFFTFHTSTPSSLVARTMELAFFSSFGSNTVPIVSTSGVMGADKVRLPHPTLQSFLPTLAVLPEGVVTKADLMVARLRERGLLSDISLDDVIRELAKNPLNEEQMLACLQWWQTLVKMPEYDVSLRSRLLDAAVLVFNQNETDDKAKNKQSVIPLSMVRTYLNPSTIPSDMPLPPYNFPYQISKQMDLKDLRLTFDWSELTVASWISYITDASMIGTTADPDTDITTNAAFSDRVFGVLSRAWARIAQAQKDTIIKRLNAVACVPTRMGFKTPKEAYFVDVDLFPDLAILDFPSLQVKGHARTTLAALGVRSHVELQLVFSRLVGQSKWSCYELIRYLVSVKGTLSDHEMARLKRTAAFPVAPKTPVTEADNDTTSSKPIKRVTADSLYEPTAEHLALGVDVLDWGAPWKPNTAEAHFAFDLGVKRQVDLPLLIKIAADPSDAGVRERALKYLQSHIGFYPDFSATSFPDFAFIPAIDSNGKPFVAKPTEAFLNPACSIMGFATVAPMEGDAAVKLKLLKDVPTVKLVEALKQRPPLTVDTAIKQYEYLSTRLADFYQERTLNRLSDVSFIRVIDQRNPANQTGSTILARPSEVFFKPTGDSNLELYDMYRRIFLFVDMGRAANGFLEACGVKKQPSVEQLASLIVEKPYQFLKLAQTTELYLAQLRILAASYSSLPADVKRAMTKSNFLLAGKRVPAEKSRAMALVNTLSGNADDYDDDYTIEYDLAKASEICIVDDPNSYNLFSTDVKAAPQEDLLEDFYGRLGAQPLSRLVREEYNTAGVPQRDQPTANALRKLILERLALFLSERVKSASDVSLEWLRKEGNFSVLEVKGLNLKRTYRQGQVERSNVQAMSAAIIQSRGSCISLYISQSMELDMYEVASALVKTLFKRTRPDEPLLLMTMLTTPLPALKRRGYNVDRILNQQRAERLSREAQMKQEQEREQAEIRSKMLSPEAKALAMKDLQDLFPNEDPGYLSSVLDAQTSDHLVNATNEVLEKTPNHPSSTTKNETSVNQLTRSVSSATTGARQSTTSMLGNIRNKFRNSGMGEAERPINSQPKPRDQEAPSSKVTPADDIRDNALRAVAASRPNVSKDIVSQQQRHQVKESADTYCDTTGVNTNLKEAGEVIATGIKVFVDRGIADSTALTHQHAAQFRRFAESVVIPLGKVFKLPVSSMAIFYDQVGPLIAFNRGGAIYFNARYYEAWHDAAVLHGDTNEALISWYHTTSHEIAHNISPNHDSEHEFYFSSICETFFIEFIKLLK